jgi:hypothetical protein
MWSGKNSLVPCGGIIAPPEKGWFVALRIAAVVNCLAMPPTVIARKVSKLARINRDIFAGSMRRSIVRLEIGYQTCERMLHP